MFNESTRKRIIIEARQMGGLAIPHLKLQIHQNGAKFPISRVYVEDEQLDSHTYYTIIAIPENPKDWGLVLTYFHPTIGPDIFYTTPKEIWDKDLIDACTQWMDDAKGPGFFPSIAKKLHGLNILLEIPSEWNRTGKEILLISYIADTKPNIILEDTISTEFSKVAEAMKNEKGLFKAFYKNDAQKKADLPEIDKMWQKIQDYLNKLRVNCGPQNVPGISDE